LEQSVHISEVQIIEEIPEKAENQEKKQEAAEEEEEEEDKLQRRLWERKVAKQQIAETVKMNQEPLVLIMVPKLASSGDVATLFSEVNSPHHSGNLRDKQYSEVCQGLFRRHNQENLFHPNVRTIWRKAKHKTKASNQRSNSRKKKVKVILDLLLGSEAQIHKQCRVHLYQQISNPYRKEVRDEGGTGKVGPLVK
jgi:hypothetical protein